MDITGTHSVPGPRDRVFAALCDPAVLMRCIPVLEEMERLSATDYAARVRTTLGPMKARFSGRLKLEPEDGIHRYRLVAQGNGGLAGAVKGEALVVLEEDDGGRTLLTYSLTVALGGGRRPAGGEAGPGQDRPGAGRLLRTLRRGDRRPS
ncbi:CoxG family protein [Azospirillum sp. INR13]|uniref:CoxG family protein n=1 Tax=Azospirillum sp. INR13 TaxID=2596919 RepID=UPI002106AA3D|nr:carbon monoxide dehydrogenase subunit G [Azospirillum sp. INR13]